VVLASSGAAALLLVIGFTQFGDWPGISRSVPRTLEQFSRPYFVEKYQAHAVWLLDDAALEGNLFNEYYMGGFLGYWLAPRLRTFVNGSLNVSRDAIDANLPIRERRGALAGESFLELLDRQAIDIFLGIGLPRVKPSNRPWYHTTAHLENAPGWIPVFRNITSALYLRDHPRNFDKLERVAAYYRDRGVPFDSKRGFDTARVIREARDWAIANGVVPTYWDQMVAASNDTGSKQRPSSLNLLASFYSALGLYAEAIEIDRSLLELNWVAPSVRRRLAWCSLRLGRFAEALELARVAPRRDPLDPLLQAIAEVARIAAVGGAEVSGPIARLPVFTRAQARNLRAGMARPVARPAPRKESA
jgi:tetratricopeptide (TPR) repeat protein